jgi:hypothetical protein
VSAFADPQIIKMATDDFVPVSADDWYQRRRQDAEGEFFRKVSDQGPRKTTGGGTRQGIYCFTADGELLEYKNAGGDAAATRDQLKRALAKFDRLPRVRTAPGAVPVPPLAKTDPNYSRTPPPGGLIVRANARILDRTPGGGYVKGSCGFTGGDKASRDFLWLTRDEVRSLAPVRAEPGFSYPLPKPIADRIVLFHLLDNTRGEPAYWRPDQVRTATFTLTVADAGADGGIDLRLDGAVLVSTDSDPAKADRGYEAKVSGKLRYDVLTDRVTRFDVAVLGDHWGSSGHTGTARPGRSPLGIAFGLADPDNPADRVPPQGARERNAYWGR